MRRTSPASTSSATDGFTLIEVIVAAAIVAMAVSAAVASSFAAQRLLASAEMQRVTPPVATQYIGHHFGLWPAPEDTATLVITLSDDPDWPACHISLNPTQSTTIYATKLAHPNAPIHAR